MKTRENFHDAVLDTGTISFMRYAIFACIPLLGCARDWDITTEINVAPSAEMHMPALLEAVDQLNVRVGDAGGSPGLFKISAVSYERKIDNEAVVRGVLELSDGAVGERFAEHDGVVISLLPTVSVFDIAHELGHAAGLWHSPDPHNLMYIHPATYTLSADQLDYLRSLTLLNAAANRFQDD